MPFTNTTFTPEMGGTELVYSRLITLNDDNDTIRYVYVGKAHETAVEDGSGKPVNILEDNIGGSSNVDDSDATGDSELTSAQARREVARQAVMALIDNLDDDQLVEELAYLFRYADTNETDNLKVDTPKEFGKKLKLVLQEMRSATANLDGETISSGDDVYALIPLS